MALFPTAPGETVPDGTPDPLAAEQTAAEVMLRRANRGDLRRNGRRRTAGRGARRRAAAPPPHPLSAALDDGAVLRALRTAP